MSLSGPTGPVSKRYKMNITFHAPARSLRGLFMLLIALCCTPSLLNAQDLGTIEGERNPCPGEYRYTVAAEGIWCSVTEFEFSIQQMDANGNIVDLGLEPIGTAELYAYQQLNGHEYGVNFYEFDVTWLAPPSTQYDRAVLCFRAKCKEPLPGGSYLMNTAAWFSTCCTVRIKTMDPVDIIGPSSFECCSAEPLRFCADPGSSSSYDWNFPSGWQVVGADDASCVTVIPNEHGGTVSVRPYFDECDQWGPTTNYSVSATTCNSAGYEVVRPVGCDDSPVGSLRAVVPDGYTISSITWRDQNGNVVGTQEVVTGLGAGMYTAEIDLGSGCTALVNAELTPASQDDPIDVDFDFSVYDSDGWHGGTSECMFHVVATVSGGFPPYNYDWDGFTTSGQDVYVNAEGGSTVTLTITDARGCERTFTVNVPNCALDRGPDIRELTASPNPTNGTFTTTVGVDVSGDLDLFIVDVYNNPVYTHNAGQVSAGTHTYSVDISNEAAGLYFLTATLDNADPVTVQVVKQ